MSWPCFDLGWLGLAHQTSFSGSGAKMLGQGSVGSLSLLCMLGEAEVGLLGSGTYTVLSVMISVGWVTDQLKALMLEDWDSVVASGDNLSPTVVEPEAVTGKAGEQSEH
ncbi:hypothetical protein FB451DRAFT_1167168 [Mycena latifolia]|nr:hypothetical protein FB451DRAFT_1167168 [Mycena latifolia]